MLKIISIFSFRNRDTLMTYIRFPLKLNNKASHERTITTRCAVWIRPGDIYHLYHRQLFLSGGATNSSSFSYFFFFCLFQPIQYRENIHRDKISHGGKKNIWGVPGEHVLPLEGKSEGEREGKTEIHIE